MTYKDAIKRAVATFVFGALSSPIGSAVLNVETWKVALSAGIAAVVNWVYRAVEAYIDSTEGF
jgi:hypothetical protein